MWGVKPYGLVCKMERMKLRLRSYTALNKEQSRQRGGNTIFRECILLHKVWKPFARIRATPKNSIALAHLARKGLIKPLPSMTLEETAQYFEDVVQKAEEVRKDRCEEYKGYLKKFFIALSLFSLFVFFQSR